MTEFVFPKTDGEVLFDGDANALNMTTVEAGENISAGKVVYIHLTDGKAYLGDTGTANDIRATGIAVTTATSGNDISIQTGGNWITSGLTDKGDYYLGAAGAISETVTGVRIGTAISTTVLFINIIQDDRDVVGTMKAWHESSASMPSNMLTAFWLKADGSAISDAESPINGDTLPDPNNQNYFVRGNTTSGGTGGSLTTDAGATGSSSLAGGDSLATRTHTHIYNPPFLDMVWIVKIK